MRITKLSRLAFLAVALAFLWVAAFLGLATFADGCGLEFVLPWFDASTATVPEMKRPTARLNHARSA